MERAIGVIDSGVGGLTVASELMRQLPNEQIIYVGDTLRCPYGPRPRHEVIQYTLEMVHFLIQKNIKMLVIACNTATAYALDAVKETFDIPVVGVIQPGVRAAIKATRTNKVGIIGTEGTINSNAYPNGLRKVNQNIEVTSLACPQFVPMVEKGITKGPEAEKVVKRSLDRLMDQPIDTLVLGCTHYPLLEKTIQSVLGDTIKLISSSEETARETSLLLERDQLLYPIARQPNHYFYSTGDLTLFKNIAMMIFNEQPGQVQKINIDTAVLTL